jgi:predicted NBD/HSP70 family sugar kinase
MYDSPGYNFMTEPGQRRETLGEWWAEQEALGRKYVRLHYDQLFALDKAGDPDAKKELEHRDAAYSALGQG